MIFTLYLADCIGNEENCLYRNEKPDYRKGLQDYYSSGGQGSDPALQG